MDNAHPSQSAINSNVPAHGRKSSTQADRVDSINRIRNSITLYEILGVSRDASSEDINVAYKKLALDVHPDKNSEPGATEAFQKLSAAILELTEPEKRKKYDVELEKAEAKAKEAEAKAKKAEAEAKEAEVKAKESEQGFNIPTEVMVVGIGATVILTGLAAWWFWSRSEDQEKKETEKKERKK